MVMHSSGRTTLTGRNFGPASSALRLVTSDSQLQLTRPGHTLPDTRTARSQAKRALAARSYGSTIPPAPRSGLASSTHRAGAPMGGPWRLTGPEYTSPGRRMVRSLVRRAQGRGTLSCGSTTPPERSFGPVSSAPLRSSLPAPSRPTRPARTWAGPRPAPFPDRPIQAGGTPSYGSTARPGRKRGLVSSAPAGSPTLTVRRLTDPAYTSQAKRVARFPAVSPPAKCSSGNTIRWELKRGPDNSARPTQPRPTVSQGTRPAFMSRDARTGPFLARQTPEGLTPSFAD